MPDKDLTQGQSLLESDRTRYKEIAAGIFALIRGAHITGSDVTLSVTSEASSAIVFGDINTVAAGNGVAAVVVAANANRRALIITNVSDTTIFIGINDNVNLILTAWTFELNPGDTLVFDEPITQQAIYSICSAAAKNLTYQEGV
jgi:hypothetical protein